MIIIEFESNLFNGTKEASAGLMEKLRLTGDTVEIRWSQCTGRFLEFSEGIEQLGHVVKVLIVKEWVPLKLLLLRRRMQGRDSWN